MPGGVYGDAHGAPTVVPASVARYPLSSQPRAPSRPCAHVCLCHGVMECHGIPLRATRSHRHPLSGQPHVPR